MVCKNREKQKRPNPQNRHKKHALYANYAYAEFVYKVFDFILRFAHRHAAYGQTTAGRVATLRTCDNACGKRPCVHTYGGLVNSHLYGIIPVFSLFLVHIIITKLATKSIKFRKFLNGKPIIIIQNGNIMPDVMKELNLNIDDIMEALRGAGCFNPSEVEYAILETNGNMSVLQKSANRPLSPSDVQLNPPKAEIPVTVIMEGEFVAENVATLEGNVKEDVLAYLNDIEMKQEDILVLLLAGQDVFIQPYKGHFITATINSSADSSDDGNGCNNDSNNDSNGDCEQQNSCAEKQDELCDSQKADKAFSLFHGGEKQ